MPSACPDFEKICNPPHFILMALQGIKLLSFNSAAYIDGEISEIH